MNDTTQPQTPADGTVPPQDGPAQPQQPYAAPTPPYVAPAPMLESDARTIAMLVHILAAVALVVSAGTLAFVVPLVMWLIYRERSALVDWHGKTNLNLQLTSLVVVIASVLIGLLTLGIGFAVTWIPMIGYPIYALVISIIAGVKANRGEYYRIPLIIPFIR
ncbi:DUF4870 domain-containing protein [Demequina sp. SYSU T00192]|uniref:DUF4870 domain-containing protein n=1 Tax=Demequina litoralis TaxID=3051660 RepID=A0ABT8GBI5_9MICO|nr:DUF4870 domain-containing protein [Demequina sp. SYSU T00192]MDN4476505.1 DUF4870 domain-containing protein [Demequina sp. SYSU T00192]